jgi:aminoglycoside phosphotransferase
LGRQGEGDQLNTGPEGALERLRAATGDRFDLVGRLPGGETGAHEVRSPSGERFVLKWDLDPASQLLRRDAAGLTDRLRTEAGWPVPRLKVLQADGWLLVLQEFMAGRAPDVLTNQMTDQLLQLHARRIGLSDVPSSRAWSDRLIATLVQGGRGYCQHESLRQHDTRTADLVEEIEAFDRSLRADDLMGADIVHWDLHVGNLLVDEHGISAVVDTDFCGVGDASFDLVTLALTSRSVACEEGVPARLFEAGVDPLTETRRRAFLGHLFIRLLDWATRRWGDEAVEFWLSEVSWYRSAGYF